MSQFTRLIILTCLLSLYSCNNHDIKKTVTGYNYNVLDSLWVTMEYQSTHTDLPNHYKIAFQEINTPEIIGTFTIVINKDTRDSIQFLDLNCPLMESQDIMFGKSKVKVYKYLYDEVNSIDEEAAIYLTENNQLIAISSIAWGGYEIFEKSELTQALRKDSLGFF